jgi:hypothetical protein
LFFYGDIEMKMKIVYGVLGLASLVAASVANAATVSVNPASQTVVTGSTFQLTVSGSDFLDGAVAGGFLMTWDPTVARLDTTAADALGGALGPSWTDLLGFTPTANSLDVSAAVSFFLPPVGVGGTAFDFITLNFTALAPVGTAINIGVGIGGPWQDGNLLNVDPTYVGATVTVSAVPVPAAVWLFGSGLLGLVGVARRRQVA